MKWNGRRVRQTWDTYRKRYFLDGERVPPLSHEVRWIWLPTGSPDLGETTWDDDNQVCDEALNSGLLLWPDLLKITLLHELTHCRLGPGVQCPSMGKRKRMTAVWRKEQERLAALGAPLL